MCMHISITLLTSSNPLSCPLSCTHRQYSTTSASLCLAYNSRSSGRSWKPCGQGAAGASNWACCHMTGRSCPQIWWECWEWSPLEDWHKESTESTDFTSQSKRAQIAQTLHFSQSKRAQRACQSGKEAFDPSGEGILSTIAWVKQTDIPNEGALPWSDKAS